MAWLNRDANPSMPDSPSADSTILRDAVLLLLAPLHAKAQGVLKSRVERVQERLARFPMPTGLNRELEAILQTGAESGAGREDPDLVARTAREAGVMGKAIAQALAAAAIRDTRLAAAVQEMVEGFPQAVNPVDARRITKQAEALHQLAGPAQARVREERDEMTRLISQLATEISKVSASGSTVGQQIAQVADDLRAEVVPEDLRAAREALLSKLRLAISENEKLRQGLQDATQRAQSLEAVVATQQRELIDLQSRASRDALTGLCNRGTFDRAIGDYVQRAQSHLRPLSLVIVDIDHFKKVNDTWGHPAGDEVLRQVAASLTEHVREGDIVARLGGEEFAILLERANQKSAQAVAERMREGVSALRIPIQGPDGRVQVVLQVTSSGGVAELTPQDDPSTLYKRADTALYTAKQTGRNRICLAPAG